MKVFISWSGRQSCELAKILHDWLPSVIQAVKPFYSEDDIEKGVRGNTSMAKELEETGIGILCLTSDNLEAPWVLFEAGALSKQLDTSRVCPILFGNLQKTDLRGPLAQFQAARFNENEIKKVVTTINKQLGETALAPNVLDSVFAKWWPELNDKVQAVLSKSPQPSQHEVRSERDLLEEVLELTRQIRSRTDLRPSLIGSMSEKTKSDDNILALAIDDLRSSGSEYETFKRLLKEGLRASTATNIVGRAAKILKEQQEKIPLEPEEDF